MLHRIYKLHFLMPVRFGRDEGGELLTNARSTAHADTLFSAMYLSLMKTGEADAFLNAVKDKEFQFSDTFPYCKDELYIPKPIGIFGKPVQTEDPGERKKLKRISYIPLSDLNAYLRGTPAIDKYRTSFGVEFEQQRVNLRDFDESKPYTVSGFRFFDDCGLYVIVTARTPQTIGLFEKALMLLSQDGFGGKVSSGYGRFEYEVKDAPLALSKALDDKTAPRQMLLNCALPGDEEGEAVLSDASYVLVRRGGYNNGLSDHVYKKRTVYLMSAGSTVQKRFKGCMMNVGDHSPHPVWRYAMGMFMGVKVV